ncbi:MAG TPA: hypothetical protein VIQ30_07055 [Pseudonocardia sp.]|jgi:hypothetical protein
MTSIAHPSSPNRTSSAPSTATSAADSPALVRFVTDGLLATIEAYRIGTLPLHRFAWELDTRIDTLAGLAAPTRVVTRLRWLARSVELLRTDLADRAALTGDEENSLIVTLVDLSTVLATLAPESPLDPAGAARPIELAVLRLVG